MPVFEWRSEMPVPAQEVYDYHARPGAFQRLAPPWQRLRVIEEQGTMEDGRLTFEVGRGPAHLRWAAEMHGSREALQFMDRQVQGPFAAWEHTHRFVPLDEDRSELLDHVEYRLPAGQIAGLAGEGPARKQLARLFAFRHQRTRRDLERHGRWRESPRMTVAVAGASGLIGSALSVFLTTAGHRVVRLVRGEATGPDQVTWDPVAGRLDTAALAGVDAIVNAAGESLLGVWTPGKRAAILASRTQTTGTLARAAAAMDPPPSVFVSNSGVNAYGFSHDEELTEDSPLGEGFLAGVVRAWEQAADPAREAGVRVVHTRLAPVMTAAGGTLATMLPVFRAGLGGTLGDGSQWWSWVALDDVLAAVEWALHDDGLSGAVNVAAPLPITNAQFTQALARVLHRPAALKVPRAVLEHALGDMGREMMLVSLRVRPERLQERGFAFGFPDATTALRYELGRLSR
jgi:uncharacterized protein (TIGR01777 family)